MPVCSAHKLTAAAVNFLHENSCNKIHVGYVIDSVTIRCFTIELRWWNRTWTCSYSCNPGYSGHSAVLEHVIIELAYILCTYICASLLHIVHLKIVSYLLCSEDLGLHQLSPPTDICTYMKAKCLCHHIAFQNVCSAPWECIILTMFWKLPSAPAFTNNWC